MAIQNLNQGSMLSNISSKPVGDTYRGLFSDWFNKGNVADEDWKRTEQAANNQMYRDLYFQSFVNDFNSTEAQKNRDWQELMSNTSYQRAVQDLKLAGLNPILAYSNGGASTPQGSTANSSSSRTNSNNNYYAGTADTSRFLSAIGTVFQVVAGLVTGPKKILNKK